MRCFYQFQNCQISGQGNLARLKLELQPIASINRVALRPLRGMVLKVCSGSMTHGLGLQYSYIPPHQRGSTFGGRLTRSYQDLENLRWYYKCCIGWCWNKLHNHPNSKPCCPKPCCREIKVLQVKYMLSCWRWRCAWIWPLYYVYILYMP
jgi:hypothetical protein